jgi:hypothetical protein
MQGFFRFADIDQVVRPVLTEASDECGLIVL